MLGDLWRRLAQRSSSCQYAVRVIARVAGQRSSGRCGRITGGVLQHGFGEARQLGGSQRVAASVKQRVARLLFGGLSCCEGSGGVAHAQRIHCWVAARVEQVVEACGGLVDQSGHAVRVLGVTLEGGVGGGGASSGAVAVRRSQVILQTLDIFRVADSQQLSLLLMTEEGLQDGGVVVEASGALHGQRQHGGEDRGGYLGGSWSWLRLRGGGLGAERVEAVGVEVRVAHPDGSRLDGGGHHHRGLRLAGGLGDALWVVGIGARLVDFAEMIEVVVEGRALL